MRLDAVHMPPELSSALPPRCHEYREQRLRKLSADLRAGELVYEPVWQKWLHRWGGFGRGGALSLHAYNCARPSRELPSRQSPQRDHASSDLVPRLARCVTPD